MNLKNKKYLFLSPFLFLEGFFPIFAFFLMQKMGTLFATAFALLIAFIILGGIVTYQKKWKEYKTKEAWLDILGGSIFLGGLYFSLYFYAIKLSDPNTASILLLTQVFFSFLLFNVLQKDEYKKEDVLGAILMVIGAIVILYKGGLTLNFGAVLMLIVAIVATIGNFFQKRAREKVSAIFILFNRNFISFLTVITFAFIFENVPTSQNIQESLIWIFAIAVLIFVISKTLWIESIHRMPVFIAISFLPLIPLFVMIFSYFILDLVPTLRQVLGFIPIAIGTYLIVRK